MYDIIFIGFHLPSGHFPQLEESESESESLAQLRFRVITKAIPSYIYNSGSLSPLLTHGACDYVQVSPSPSRLRDSA